MGSTFFSCGMMLLMAMALTWLITVAWFFRRLRTRHSAAYEAIGSPTLFWNNSPRLGWLTHRFLWSSRPRELGDSTIARLTIFMRVWIVAYVVLFFGLIALAAFTAYLRAGYHLQKSELRTDPKLLPNGGAQRKVDGRECPVRTRLQQRA